MRFVLNDTFLVDHLAYKEELPRPVAEFIKRVAPHRERVDPRHAGFEMILALSRYGLPLALSLLDGSATAPSDIGLYKALVEPTSNMLLSSSMFALPPHDAAELHPRSIDYFLTTLPAVVDGNAHPPRRNEKSVGR